MEPGLKENKKQTIANPIYDFSKGQRIPSDDLYSFGEVGDIVRVFYEEYYLNAPVAKIEGDTRYIDVGDKYVIQKWDTKRWRKAGTGDKEDV